MAKSYIAFISYNREDKEHAKWLQNKLEHYKLPTAVRKNNPSLPNRARPIFRDETDLSGIFLNDAIKEALLNSKYLIVVCSPRASQSKWVSKEVQEFIDSGRTEYIIPYIIEGEANSKCREKECFPKSLQELSNERELLGINVNEAGGRNAAAIKVVARMFDLHYDTLWQRMEREDRRRRRLVVVISLMVAIIALILASFFFFQRRKMQVNIARVVASRAEQLIQDGDSYLARKLLLEVLPDENDIIPYPYVSDAERVMRAACSNNSGTLINERGVPKFSSDGKYVILASLVDETILIKRIDITSGYCVNVDSVNYPGRWTPKGRIKKDLLVASDSLNNFIIWDIAKNKLVQKFNGNNKSLSSFMISETGDFVVSTYNDTVKLWNVNNGKCVKTLKSRDGSSLSDDGKYLLVLEDSTLNVINIYNVNDVKILETKDRTYKAAISPNGKYVVYYVWKNGLLLWDIANNTNYILKKNEYYAEAVAFSPNGKYLVSVSRSCITVWDVVTRKCLREIECVVGGGVEIAFDFDDRYFLVSSTHNTILCSLSTYNIVQEFNEYFSCELYPNGRYVLARDGKQLRLIDLKTNQNIQEIQFGDSVKHLKFSPDGKSVLAVYKDDKIMLWSLTGECLMNYVNTGTDVSVVEFSDDGECFVSGDSNTFRIWSIGSVEPLRIIKDERCPYNGFVFSRDGRYLVSWNNVIKLWSLETYEHIRTFGPDGINPNSQVSISPNSKYVLCNQDYVNAILWSIDTENAIKVFNKKLGDGDVKFDEKSEVWMSLDGKTIVWNIEEQDTTLQLSLPLGHYEIGENGNVVSWDSYYRNIVRYNALGFFEYIADSDGWGSEDVVFSPDAKRIVATVTSRNLGKKIIMWDARSKDAAAIVDPGEINRESLKFTADSKHVLMKTKDGSGVKIWHLPPLQELIDETKERFKNVPLTANERRENYLE